jgi:hypothetical protein
MQFGELEDLTNTHSYLEAKLTLIMSMTVLSVNYGLIFLLWFFMLSDTVLGVAKAARLHGWEEVTKKAFLIGLGTKVAIVFIPLSLALVGALGGYDLNIFVHTAIWTLIANDAVSCYTNILSVKTGKSYVNKDFVEMLVNAIRKAVYLTIKNSIDRLAASNFCEDETDEPNKRSGTKKRPGAKVD